MNVLMQLYKNRKVCENRLARAETTVSEAQYPFDINRAKEALGKARRSLDMVNREILAEEQRQDSDEKAWLDN